MLELHLRLLMQLLVEQVPELELLLVHQLDRLQPAVLVQSLLDQSEPEQSVQELQMLQLMFNQETILPPQMALLMLALKQMQAKAQSEVAQDTEQLQAKVLVLLMLVLDQEQ